jgi:hypothetical protein
VERVDLQSERTVERRRWRNGGEWDEAAAKVAVGELTGGRWYVRMYGAGFSRADRLRVLGALGGALRPRDGLAVDAHDRWPVG